MILDELLKRLDIGENQDTEFKLAEEGLPKSIWETISAFANTQGGYIILGVSQHRNYKLEIIGIKNPSALKKIFWDTHNNSEKLSTRICKESDVNTVEIENRHLLVIHVPRAFKSQLPVFINGNPLIGTYKRNHEGDYRCEKTEIQQMLRDADDKPQDLKILHKFDLHDLDTETLKAFRQRFSSRDPDHPYLSYDDMKLLSNLGGWHHDRNTNEEGLTLAGLVMFGRQESISEAFPHFHLDYQEKPSNDPEQRWSYRLTIDGKWAPNLFNFYYRVYGRLVSDLNVPFRLDEKAVSKGETHVHEAIREALVNSLVHADYCSKRPIHIVKGSDKFILTNPGRLRVPIQRLYEGINISDPRNPNLQKMFQMIGLGEKAGSGFQKILRAWREQSWPYPLVKEDLELELTTVLLPMISMIPEDIIKELREIVGDFYPNLTEIDRYILVLAHRYGKISNNDIQPHLVYFISHPIEIGERLKYLVSHKWLKQSGHGRGTQYELAKTHSHEITEGNLTSYEGSSTPYGGSSTPYGGSSVPYKDTSPEYANLKLIAAPIYNQKRTSNKKLMQEIILKLCKTNYLSLSELTKLLERSPKTLSNSYLIPMVKLGLLEYKFPEKPNHPQQAYKTKN